MTWPLPSRRQLTFAAAAGALLSACGTLPRAPAGTLSGRISLRAPAQFGREARSWVADFDLRGDGERGELSLTGPLGAMLARASWLPGRAQLETPGSSRSFTSLEALTEAMLGESLPLAALIEWMRGRPWTGAPSARQERGFEQLEWRIDLARFADGIVDATRERAPTLNVRVKLETAA